LDTVIVFLQKKRSMLLDITIDDIQVIVTGLLIIAAVWLLIVFLGMKKEIEKRLDIKHETLRLRLQAYERLTVFADRASLKNLVSRTSFSGANVVDVQLALLETLRTEYEYNVSQQIYVTPDMWRAITNLKDQNAYIINQLAGSLSSQASGIELSKRILEYSAIKNAELNIIVLDALQYEAKQLF
jgi:hypothetical protein